MKTAIIVAAIVICGLDRSCAQSEVGADEPRIEYLGGITLCANDPKALAQWYTEAFGISVDKEFHGMYYGTLKFKDVELNFGIHPTGEECHKTAKGFAMTFHVDDYAKYLSKLRAKGLVPYKSEDAGRLGRFAYFLDLENNQLAIWGN